jgi:hypothetical protein
LSVIPSHRVPLAGLMLSMGMHILVGALATQWSSTAATPPASAPVGPEIVWLQWPAPEARTDPQAGEAARPSDPQDLAPEPDIPVWEPQQGRASASAREPATQAAPPAPTAEEWAFASRYTLKNSKAYRYSWGQQVRSMMGTSVAGPDQGTVRFRVVIAPDGALAELETLWSTSAVAERLARQAIASMPSWPATPTGEPLVFERTISFTPFASNDPPLYKDDCLPDPTAFSNPFAWDGTSAPQAAAPKPIEKPDPQALADCLKQLPQDSIEAESAQDRRLMERWGWSSTGLDR